MTLMLLSLTQEKQHPVMFEEATLCGSKFQKVDLSDVQLIVSF